MDALNRKEKSYVSNRNHWCYVRRSISVNKKNGEEKQRGFEKSLYEIL